MTAVQAMANELMNGTARDESDAAAAPRFVVFRLGARTFGVPLAQVREVVALGTVTPIPFAPSKVRGAVNLGGRVAIVIDLRTALGLPAHRETGAEVGLAVEHDGHLYTLIVDAVDEMPDGEAGDAAAERVDIAAVVSA